MKKIFTLLFLSIFLLSFASAVISKDFQLDTEKSRDSTTQYGTVVLKDRFFLDVFGWFEETKAEITLEENTDVCGTECSATKEIIMYEKGRLIDSVYFETILSDGSRIEQPIRSSQFFIQTSQEEVEVDDYEWVCENVGFALNGSAIQECNEIKVGSHIEYIPEWIPYNYEEVEAGTYKIKLEGEKRPDRTVDWIIVSQGKALDVWAEWGGIPTTEANNIGYSVPGPDGNDFYFTITPNVDVILTNITKHASDNRPSVQVRYGNGTTIVSGNYVGSVYTIPDGGIELQKGVNYQLFNPGYVGTIYRNSSFNSFPIENTYVTWNNRTGDSSTIVSITMLVNKIELNSPEDGYTSPSNSVTFNATIYQPLAELVNASLFINDVLNATNIISGNTNTTTWTISLDDGEYNWSVQAYDDDGDFGWSDNRTLTIDTGAPIITINNPLPIINYGGNGYNETLNVTILDDTLDTCYYILGQCNPSGIPPFCTFPPANQVTFNCSETTNFTLTQEQVIGGTTHQMQVYANDTVGNLANELVIWDYKVFENSQTFQPIVTEGSIQSFILNLTLSPGVQISQGTFNYNGTTASPSISSSGNSRILSVSNFEIPSFSLDSNVSFFWQINLADSTTFNTTSQTQSIETINLDNCTTYTNQIFNISLKDERTRNPINGTIELFYEVLNKPNYNQIKTLSAKFENVANTLVCSESDLSIGDLAYSAEIKYYAPNYASELYNIQRADITNITPNLNLYDLHSNFSTEFKIIYQDDSYIFVEGAIIQLQRKYIEDGIYEIVEAPLTSNEGTAVVHIDLDTNVYRATVVKNGVVLDEFDNLVFICESQLVGQCTQQLLGSINPQNSITLDSLLDFTYSDPIIINETISLSFSVPSGSPSTIGISLVQKDQFGNKTLCNQEVTSSAGSIQCNFIETIGESYLDLTLTKNGELILQQSYIIPEENGLDFLGNNFFIVLLLLLSIVGMAFTSPEWIVINGIVTFVIAGALWLINGLNFVIGLGSLVWLVIGAGILIFKMAKQEDK